VGGGRGHCESLPAGCIVLASSISTGMCRILTPPIHPITVSLCVKGEIPCRQDQQLTHASAQPSELHGIAIASIPTAFVTLWVTANLSRMCLHGVLEYPFPANWTHSYPGSQTRAPFTRQSQSGLSSTWVPIHVGWTTRIPISNGNIHTYSIRIESGF
jgi:hypothetical protein